MTYNEYQRKRITFCKMNVCWIGLAGAFVAFGCQIPNGAGNDAQKGCKSHQDSQSRNHFSFALDEKGDTHELLWLNEAFLTADFLKLVQCQSQLNREIQPYMVQGIHFTHT